MTLTDAEIHAALAADYQQAAYFRDKLRTERQALIDGIAKRRPLIQRHSATSRLHAAIRSAEAEVRYLDRLIERIERRFALPDLQGDHLQI